MLTPQDIQNKEFVKAVFGGYDMTAVDDFLEEIAEDYAALHKENAVLKSKIKVLVEKVEEYRSTEDAMRAALLTAQKMGDDLLKDAKEKSEGMLKDAKEKSEHLLYNSESTVKEQMRQCDKKLEFEKKRLAEAQEKTSLFIQASRQIIEKHTEFINKLEDLQYKSNPEPSKKEEPAKQAEPQKPKAVEKKKPSPSDEEVKAAQREQEIVNTAKEIDKAVSGMTRDDAEPSGSSSNVTDNTVRFRTKDTTVDWSDDDEPTSPRPKFDFDDLKFGSNYDDEN
jgi:cell division initiation protein